MMFLCVDVIMQRDRHTSCGGGISQRGQLHLCDRPCPLLLLKFRQETSRFDAHDIFIYNCLYHHHVECPDLLCRLLCCAGQNLHFCFVLDNLLAIQRLMGFCESLLLIACEQRAAIADAASRRVVTAQSHS